MSKRYFFVGGGLNNKMFTEDEAEFIFQRMGNGLSEDLSDIRNQGGLVHRAELDNEFQFKGYLGPMWDSVRYIVDGIPKYEWECTDEEKETCESFYVLRYETQEIYDLLSL